MKFSKASNRMKFYKFVCLIPFVTYCVYVLQFLYSHQYMTSTQLYFKFGPVSAITGTIAICGPSIIEYVRKRIAYRRISNAVLVRDIPDEIARIIDEHGTILDKEMEKMRSEALGKDFNNE